MSSTKIKSGQPETINSGRDKTNGRFTKDSVPHNASDLNALVTVGQMFGDFVVINAIVQRRGSHRYVQVACSHGEFWKSYDNLKAGKSKGCTKCATARIKKYCTPLEKALNKRGFAARHRCNGETNPSYQNYGGRGIEFRFESIEAYVNYCKTLSNASIDLEIDRINNDGHYEPGNLQFSTRSEQNFNKSTNNLVEYDEKFIPISIFTRDYTDLSDTTVKRLLDEGMSPEDIRNHSRQTPGGRESIRSIKLRKGEPLCGK